MHSSGTEIHRFFASAALCLRMTSLLSYSTCDAYIRSGYTNQETTKAVSRISRFYYF
jgi:hypothetical protein